RTPAPTEARDHRTTSSTWCWARPRSVTPRRKSASNRSVCSTRPTARRHPDARSWLRNEGGPSGAGVAVVAGDAGRGLLPGAAAPPPQTQFTFRDVGDEVGLYPDVAGIAGHAAAWGDVDGDGWPDLYVGTFGGAPYGSKPALFFRNVKGKFKLDPQKHLRIEG